jgi:predicted porin
MNKKLITLAIAAAMAAPAAAMADATLYGKAHVSLDYVDVDPFANWGVPPVNSAQLASPSVAAGLFNLNYNAAIASGASPITASQFGLAAVNRYTNINKFNGWGMNQNSRASRIGVKGSEDLGNGLKAIYQIEFGVDLTNEARDSNIANGNRGTGGVNYTNSGIYLRNSFVGLAGNWGTFLMGRHDTPLKISTAKLDLFEDTLADYNYTIGFADVRADNTVTYISPSFAGLQFAGAIIPSGGATAGTGFNKNNDSIAGAYSLALIYSNGPFYASAAYENLGNKYWQNDDLPVGANTLGIPPTAQVYLGRPGYGSGADDYSYWRIGLGLLDWNGFTLDGIYESQSNVAGAPKDSDAQLWQIQAAYAFGNNAIKGMYGQSNLDHCVGSFAGSCTVGFNPGNGNPYLNAGNQDSWAVGLDHNFSKRTQAYLLYTQTSSDSENADWSGFSLGMIHSF